MLKHDEARLIYLSHPRTASIATEHALKTVGFEWVHNASRHQRIWRCDWWCYLTDAERAEWTVLTTVRNPFDATVSWYLNRPYNFETMCPEWFEMLLDNEHPYLLDGRLWKLHGHPADHVLRFEELPGCLDVLSEYGVDVPELPRKNVTEKRRGRHYSEFYTPEMRRLVREQFAEDFREYGYRWETVESEEAA